MKFLKSYFDDLKRRREIYNIPPKPLRSSQVSELVKIFLSGKNVSKNIQKLLVNIFMHKVPVGTHKAAFKKASFLFSIAKGEIFSSFINQKLAIFLLGQMHGGYSINFLVRLLDEKYSFVDFVVKALSRNIFLFDKFDLVVNKFKNGNLYAKKVLQSWANFEWFFNFPAISNKLSLVVFKVSGETTTDDLSPATDAWSRSDIPLHAQSFLKNFYLNSSEKINSISIIRNLSNNGFPLAYVGDIVGTGSSRKSAVNSLLWHFGHDIPFIPNKKNKAILLAKKVAPIFFDTMRDSGCLIIETDVSLYKTGDVIDLYLDKGKVFNHSTNNLLSVFKFRKKVFLDEFRVGGRINFLIGQSLSIKSMKCLGISNLDFKEKLNKFNKEKDINKNESFFPSFTLAQKIVGKACGKIGVLPGEYCEPKVMTIGSQDTTGPMTKDELKDLGCLNFSKSFFLQTFCHTAAYPKEIDLKNERILSKFFKKLGGICLKFGDGIIHSWLNRMLLPDTVGIGGDSHTRFPIGISFSAASGLIAFSSSTGFYPLDMPESILVKFVGKMKFGITVRDLVNSIPYYARKKGLLTLEKEDKKNVFSGRILEIDGLSNLSVEQAFELTNSSAERSSIACVIKLSKKSVIEYISSNILLLEWMIKNNYENNSVLKKRIHLMRNWLDNPVLLKSDYKAKYKEVLEINLDEINEPFISIPNDPDHVKKISDIHLFKKINEVFIGSCMMNIVHFRISGEIFNENFVKKVLTKLWIVPPTKLDFLKLKMEGYIDIFKKVGARIEIPGCSVCMGNQARLDFGSTVVSTSTRNFQNRLGDNVNAFLSSVEVATISSIIGRLPSKSEYFQYVHAIKNKIKKISKYLNFSFLKEI